MPKKRDNSGMDGAGSGSLPDLVKAVASELHVKGIGAEVDVIAPKNGVAVHDPDAFEELSTLQTVKHAYSSNIN